MQGGGEASYFKEGRKKGERKQIKGKEENVKKTEIKQGGLGIYGDYT